MDVKDAVRTAKDYLADLFAGEEIANVGLEEVTFDDRSKRWSITIGFSRPWDQPGRKSQGIVATLSESTPRARSYKVLRVNDKTGRVESLTDRFRAS